MSAKNHPISKLSFVKSKRGGRCFWHVRSTGDPYKDEQLGQRFALEYLALEEAETDGPGYLQLIVRDMPRKNGFIELGFLALVSYAAGAGAFEARRVEEYWRSRRTKAAA